MGQRNIGARIYTGHHTGLGVCSEYHQRDISHNAMGPCVLFRYLGEEYNSLYLKHVTRWSLTMPIA